MAHPKLSSDFRPLGTVGGLHQYEYAGAIFALLPGGEVTLGFSGHWEPTAEELESWKETQEEYELPGSCPAEFIATVTTPVRTLEFPPLLVEVEFQNLQWIPTSQADPILEKVRENPAVCDGRAFSDGRRTLKITREKDGSLRGFSQREHGPSHSQIVADLASQGFRLPSAEEWEYACAAGSRTLFHWGDHVPCDRYPVDPPRGGWNQH